MNLSDRGFSRLNSRNVRDPRRRLTHSMPGQNVGLLVQPTQATSAATLPDLGEAPDLEKGLRQPEPAEPEPASRSHGASQASQPTAPASRWPASISCFGHPGRCPSSCLLRQCFLRGSSGLTPRSRTSRSTCGRPPRTRASGARLGRAAISDLFLWLSDHLSPARSPGRQRRRPHRGPPAVADVHVGDHHASVLHGQAPVRPGPRARGGGVVRGLRPD